MRVDEPSWWYAPPTDLRARLLAPVGRLYGWVAQRRFERHQPYRSRLPVICIGNLTAGGTGKTPLALLIAEHLATTGDTPVFLTRGYGGRLAGPIWVDTDRHTARDVGDEPLLLARVAPTLVSRDRKAGILAIERGSRPASVVIMDDGLQNPSLRKDVTIAVVDGLRGIGNGEVMPAGPLRARLEFQLGLVDAVIVNEPQSAAAAAPAGRNESAVLADLRRGFHGPVLSAVTAPAGDTSWLARQPVVAYAGIGHPARFFALLEQLGATLAARRTFPDHHHFSARDAASLLASAAAHAAQLVTTDKDFARLSGRPDAMAALSAASRTLPIRITLAERDAARLTSLIGSAVTTGGYRRGMSPR